MPDAKQSFRFWFYRILRWTLGVIFLVLGILGLFLPVLQGILFLLIAALLFSVDFPIIHRWLHHLTKRLPQFKLPVRKARQWLRRWNEKPPSESPNENPFNRRQD